jgi:predicted DNA-binding mobile mystery protein A
MKAHVREVLLKGLDQQMAALQRNVPQRPARGWLRAVRESTGITQAEVATKLGLTQQAYAQFENAEERGTITMNSLERVAEAMGCDLVYWMRPKEKHGPTFADLARFHDPKQRHLAATEHSMALEGQAVGDLPKRRK